MNSRFRFGWRARIVAGVYALLAPLAVPAHAAWSISAADGIAFGNTVQPRLALVIGVSDYDLDGAIDEENYETGPIRSVHGLSDLKNPRADAALIAKALRSRGVYVRQAINPTRSEMQALLAQLKAAAAKAGPTTMTFVFFAGHGLQFNGTNYVVPAGAKLPLVKPPKNGAQLEAILREQTVAIDDLLVANENAASSAAHMVILDACRNNPWSELIRAVGLEAKRGLADQIVRSPRTMLLFSTSPGTLAADGAGDNSLFTLSLAEAITDPNRKTLLFNFYKQAMDEVSEQSALEQVPYANGPLLDQVCISGCVRLTLAQLDRVSANGGYISYFHRGARSGPRNPKPEWTWRQWYPRPNPDEIFPDSMIMGGEPGQPDWADGFETGPMKIPGT